MLSQGLGKRLGSEPSASGSLETEAAIAGLLPVRYMSEEWATLALEAVESDPEVAKAVEGLDLSILAIVIGAPEDCYGFVFVRFEEGSLSEYRVGHDYEAVTKGLEAPTFVVSGHYDVFSAVNRGEITERRAILTGKLHLTGSVWKALKHMSAMEAVTRALNGIECET